MLHRADAAGRRRAVRADRARHADSVRHRRSRRTRARRRAASRTPTNFNRAQPRAGVRRPRARRCVGLAAKRLGVPVDRLTAADGVVRVAGDAVEARRLRRAGRGTEVQPARSTRRRSGSRRANGRCSARRSRASTCRRMATGTFEFVHNVRVPGMLHGAVVRPPGVGATLVCVDERSVARSSRRREGRRPEELRRRRRREAVAGDAGGATLKVEWTPGPDCRAQRRVLRLPARRAVARHVRRRTRKTSTRRWPARRRC